MMSKCGDGFLIDLMKNNKSFNSKMYMSGSIDSLRSLAR